MSDDDEVDDDSAIAEKSPWNSLEITKLLASLVTPVAVVFIGYMISSSSKHADDRHAQDVRDADAVRIRQDGVIELSKFIYERRVRSELLASAINRSGNSPTEDSKQELIERKRNYDTAYASWNANSQAILLLVRSTLQSPSYTYFENKIEKSLIDLFFSPLDACLTRAYDVAIRGGDGRPVLNDCKAKTLIESALNCGYAITNALYIASSDIGSPGLSEADKVERDQVEFRCKP